MATRQGRHKGAGKGTYTSCSEGGGLLRGGLPTHTPFGRSPVWPWTGARRLASCVPGASCSRA
eukprot:scaffold10391_cov94-Isochrysis_galbana.AAC.5